MSHRHHRFCSRALALAAAWACWLLAAAPAACGADSDPDLASDSGPSSDAAPRGRISVPATERDLSIPFGIHVTGSGSVRVDSISVLNAGGQFDILGHLTDVAVYERVVWPEIERELYQTIAVAPDRLYVLWFYCAGSELSEIWVEGTDGTRLLSETATGSCSYTPDPTSRLIQLPAIDMEWPEDPSGFRFDGADLQLDGATPGRAMIDGVEMTLLPFERVGCGACPPSGWYELHALLWNEAMRRLCFGIFYMQTDAPGSVDLNYGFCLPDLQPIAPKTFAASWTIP